MLTNWHNRKLEWSLALLTLVFGVWLLHPSQSMSSPSYRRILAFASEEVWAALFVAVGVAHVIALQINGRAAWTPFVRVAAAGLNSQVFFGLALAFAGQAPWLTAVPIYAGLGVMCLIAMGCAAFECGHEIHHWRQRDGS